MAALAACALPIVTNANPRGWPVSRSVGIATSRTSPAAAKAASMEAWVVLKERLPTYRRLPMTRCFHGLLARREALAVLPPARPSRAGEGRAARGDPSGTRGV